MKYSKVTGAVRWSGGTTLLERGMSAAEDHPLVVERPDLFTDEAPGARLADPAAPAAQGPPQVERATREPGETRKTKRAPAQPQSAGDAQGSADE
ncbi:hypothetical protein ACWDA3_26055 [Nonomuraea rubra]